MKKAFTMIELIFVIVIIGILAAVAIPRLAATRTDAAISVGLAEITQFISEISSEYSSKGTYTLPKEIVSDVKIYDGTNCATLSVNIIEGQTYSYCVKNNSDTLKPCVYIKPVNQDGNLTIVRASTIDGDICSGIVDSSAFRDKLEKTFINGGSHVSY